VRAVAFDGVLRQYSDMAIDRIRVMRRDVVAESLRRVLMTLAAAVHKHRDATPGSPPPPTAHQRAD
jgi:hypothetical protein